VGERRPAERKAVAGRRADCREEASSSAENRGNPVARGKKLRDRGQKGKGGGSSYRRRGPEKAAALRMGWRCSSAGGERPKVREDLPRKGGGSRDLVRNAAASCFGGGGKGVVSPAARYRRKGKGKLHRTEKKKLRRKNPAAANHLALC